MARRKSDRKSKIQPAEMTLTTAVTLPPASFNSHYIDLSQMASLVNRRFYRQGLNWAVAGFKVRVIQGGTGTFAISKLPSTWTFANSWTKGFKMWQEMNKKASDELNNVSGRFLDFKIYADSQHHSDGYGANLLPFDAAGNAATTGAWIPSKIVVPDSTFPSVEYELLGVGSNYPGAGASGNNAVSLVQGYANSRGLPYAEDPNSPGAADDASGQFPENWISSLSNEGTTQDQEVIGNLQEYDQPPYPYEGDGTAIVTQYPGGASQLPGMVVHDVTDITSTTISGSSRLKGGNFPCGLIRLDTANFGAEELDLNLYIDLVPGNHRGYLAEPMMEM